MVPMRKEKRSMAKDEALDVVRRSPYGVLSMINIRPDHPLGVGSPYAVPLNTVLHKGIIYFHCAREGHKLDNLRADSRVTLSCTAYEKVIPEQLTTAFETALVFGHAREVTDERERREAIDALVSQLAPAELHTMETHMQKVGHITGIWAIEIDDISGKRRVMTHTVEAGNV